MDSSKQPTKHTSDEIDLFELFAKGVLIIKRNTILLTTTFFIGTLIGWAYYQISPKQYESKMLISSDILTESYSKSLVENLNKLVMENNGQLLSEKTGLNPDQASLITRIEIKSAIEKSDATPENTKIYLNITVKAKDNSVWPQIQTALTNYFQNNEFVKIRVDQRKKYNNQMIEKINLELVDLENLKKKIAEGSFNQSNKEGLYLFDPTTVNSKIIELNKEKITLQNSLETVNSIQVVEGFTAFKNPASPKLSFSLVSGASVGMFLALMVIVFKAIQSTLRFAEEKLGSS